MTLNHPILRIPIAVSLWMCAALACAQQPVFTEPFPSFDPYATTQPGGVITGPALPSIGPIVDPSLPIFPAGFPVRLVVFGEFLYMRASDAAMTNYALPANGPAVAPPAPPIPVGPVAALEYGWEPGIRAGLDWVWNDYSRWVATYTQLDLKQADRVAAAPPASPLVSLVMHPSTAAADDFWTSATANGTINMQLGDVEYRRVFVEDWYRWDFLVGGRYAHLDQRFNSTFANMTTTQAVNTKVDFDGGGIRFGTRGDWRSTTSGFFIYAQATTSFIAGRFTSSYMQADSFPSPSPVVNTSRKDDRIINLTDAELGLGWHSQSRRWWFSGGYAFNTWSDIVSNAGLIRAVQASTFAPIRDRLTFDGLAARAELRF